MTAMTEGMVYSVRTVVGAVIETRVGWDLRLDVAHWDGMLIGEIRRAIGGGRVTA